MIKIGYKCLDYIDCDKGHICKYRCTYKYHNLKIEIRKFFKTYLHIELPIWKPIFYKDATTLSGTKKCPYNKSKHYTCYDCKYVCGDLLRECSNEKRLEDIDQGKYTYNKYKTDYSWEKPCRYFEKNDWADNYKDKFK